MNAPLSPPPVQQPGPVSLARPSANPLQRLRSMTALVHDAHRFGHRYAFAAARLHELLDFRTERTVVQHDLFQLIYILEGAGRVHLNSNVEPILPGDFFFLHPNLRQTWVCTQPLRAYTCLLNRPMIVAQQPEGWYLIRLNTPYRRMPIQNFPEDFLYLSELGLREYDNPNPIKRKEQLMLVKCLFLNQMIREVGAGVSWVPAADRELVARFLDLMWNEDLKLLSITELADQLNVSVKKLNATFRQHAGKTATQVYREKLVERAEQLLRNPDVPVHAVAEQLRFSSDSNFIRFFRKTTGSTPQEYRRNLQQERQRDLADLQNP